MSRRAHDVFGKEIGALGVLSAVVDSIRGCVVTMPSQATVVNVFAYDTRRFKADGDTPDAETGKVEARLLLVYILPVHLVSPWPFWMRRMVQPGEELHGYRVPEWQRLQREVVFINTWSSQWDGQRHSEEVRTLMMNIRRWRGLHHLDLCLRLTEGSLTHGLCVLMLG